MDTEPLHLVDPEDAADPIDLPPAPPGIGRCQECTILVGPGYLEQDPWPHPRGDGVVCGACLASLERRAARERPRRAYVIAVRGLGAALPIAPGGP